MERRNQDAGAGMSGSGKPSGGNDHDMQIDKETGRPVAIAPDGEKHDTTPDVPESDRLHIDPESRIPKPVQPDLA